MSQINLDQMLEQVCDNPENLPNCLGQATSKTEGGQKLCEFCRTFGVLKQAGLEPAVIA